MRSRSFKKALVAGLAAVIVGGAAIGVAAAQQTPTPSTGAQTGRAGARQAYISALANRLHITVDQLTQAMTGARQDAGLPAKPAGGFGGRGFGGRGFMGQAAATAASTLGITTDQLKQELPGHSLADVAKNHGKTANDLVTTLTAAANKRIDDAVAVNKLTADQAAQMKTRVDAMIPDAVNRQMPNRGAQPAHAQDLLEAQD